jgi:transcriptional regulator NrdR family protein
MSDDDRGIRCPSCGCRQLDVSYRKAVAGGYERVKRCAECGQRLQTTETVKRLLPPPENRSIYRTTGGI